jgi:hypothetical protein
MIGESSLLRWRHPERLMHPAAVSYMKYRAAIGAWHSNVFENPSAGGPLRDIWRNVGDLGLLGG